MSDITIIYKCNSIATMDASGTKTLLTEGKYCEDDISVVYVHPGNTYTQSDEGKVVSNGALVAQTSDTVTSNNTYDTTLINSLTVNVPVGDTVYYGSTGQLHKKDMVIPTENGSTKYSFCEYLETLSYPLATNAGGAEYCESLKEVSAPRRTTYDSNYWIRQQGNIYNKLEKVTIGSIGYPVTSIGSGNWRYGSHAMELVVECYVDASSIATVPTAVSNNINGNNVYAPSGSVVTIVYRNSTTGEVLT